MRQRKMKQRKSKQSKSLEKILTLGIAAATVVSSMSVSGGLLVPETVYAEDAAGETESGGLETDQQEPLQGINLYASVNEEYTAYNIRVEPVPEPDDEKLEYSTDGECYYDWETIPSEGIGANMAFTLYARKAAIGNKAASLATKGAITTPAASEAPVISGEEKFKDSTTVTITGKEKIYYTTDGTTPTAKSTLYTVPLEVVSTAAIKAIAIQDGHIMSAVVEKTFTKESSGGSSSGSSSSGSSSSGSSSSGGFTDSGSETAPPQDDNKDKTTTKTETREDGTVVTTTEVRAEDGSVQIKTEIRNEATGLNVTVNVSKNAKGKITSATAEILDRGFGNVKISGEALSEIVKAAGTKKVKATIKMLTKNDWVIREVTVNVNTLLKRTVKPKKMKIIEIDPETGEKLVVSKMPFRVAADGSVELDHNELGHGSYELVTADEEAALTKKILRSIKATKQSATIREKQGTYFWFEKGVNWYNVDKVTFSVLNPDVARVSSNGRITGLKPGKTVVKAVVRLENGQSKVIRMTVTVNKKK